jgi:hypothetical protein
MKVNRQIYDLYKNSRVRGSIKRVSNLSYDLNPLPEFSIRKALTSMWVVIGKSFHRIQAGKKVVFRWRQYLLV